MATNKTKIKKLCVVTCARSDYGYLKNLIGLINKDSHCELQLIVTGGHLVGSQGYTIEQIKEDNFPITRIVDANIDNSSKKRIGSSMSRLGDGFTEAFAELDPDLLIILGDRYELLPICYTAFVMGIPIAHISGGDVTEGAIDDGVRNAVTMLSSYHFPGTIDSATNIIRMRNSNKNVWAVGEPSLDGFISASFLSREYLSKDLDIDINKNWILMTIHPETYLSKQENLNMVRNTLSVLDTLNNKQVIITKSNLDLFGDLINDELETWVSCHSDFVLFSSLGMTRYLSVLEQVDFVIGNSSSGIVETPIFSVPTINIGNRQKGRYQCQNIIQSGADEKQLAASLRAIKTLSKTIDDKFYWGDGHSSEKIFEVIKNV
jgi:UDP-hydrolysing UDP-N-acetyl-D-glucosamine 2-epimerase